MQEVIGERKVVIAREITKIHEEFIRGSIDEIIEKTKEVKGEMIILIEGNQEKTLNKTQEQEAFLNLPLEEHYSYYEKQGLDKKEIIKKIAKDRGVPKNEIYMKFCK